MDPIGVAGWDVLTTWFGGEPKFHDAEVLAVELGVGSPSCVVLVHCWRTRAETDVDGRYRTDRHTIVRFALDDVVSLDLRGWMKQNVLFDLEIRPCADGFSLCFDSSVGLEGAIVGRKLHIEIAPHEV
jgi:hypothetical protein